MKHLVMQCWANYPDSDHTSVVLEVDDALFVTLKRAQERFDLAKCESPSLKNVRHDTDAKLFYASYRDDPPTEIDPPTVPTELCAHLGVMDGDEGVVKLTPVGKAFLGVLEGGFWLMWPGERVKYGPDVMYETELFTLSDIDLEGTGEEAVNARTVDHVLYRAINSYLGDLEERLDELDPEEDSEIIAQVQTDIKELESARKEL